MKPLAFCHHCGRLVPVITGGRIAEFEHHPVTPGTRIECPGSGRAETYAQQADAKPWTASFASLRPR